MDKSIGLAPMEGVSDFPFRLWTFLCSQPAFMGTPFLRVTDSFPAQIPHGWSPEIFNAQAFPYQLVTQLMGPSVERFVEIGQLILGYTDFVDLNCGCPSPKVIGKGSGSSLLKSVDTFIDYLSRATNELGSKKMSVKMRTGFENTLLFDELIQGIKGLDIKRVTIHGRTRIQKYTSYANWSLINNAAIDLPMEVYGSGDICDVKTFREKQSLAPKVKGFLIGRGALRNPWIFQEIRNSSPIKTTIAHIKESLRTYAILMEAFYVHQQKLIDFSSNGELLTLPGRFNSYKDDEYLFFWREKYSVINKNIFHSKRVEYSKRTFGRIKMLWNYLRSSLPDIFWDKQLLRSKNIEDLFDGFDYLEKQRYDDQSDKSFKLCWNQNYDWIYSGDKNLKNN